MRKPSLPVLLTLGLIVFLLLTRCGDASAQSSFANPRGDTIPRLGDFPWGMSESEATARFTPDSVEDGSGEVALSYFVTDGPLRTSIVATVIFGQSGLSRVEYTFVSTRFFATCELLFDSVLAAIAANYGEPEVSKSNDSALPFCGGVKIGRANASASWTSEEGSIRAAFTDGRLLITFAGMP